MLYELEGWHSKEALNSRCFGNFGRSRTIGVPRTPDFNSQLKCLLKVSENTRTNNILVVDDSPTMRRMVITSLGSLRTVKSTQAASGLEAIERLAIEPVDLMVLDLNMPDMHGMEVIDFVRKHQAYRDIPIVVLTTKGDESSRKEALAAGANRYLTKPFDPRQLADVVDSLLKAH